MIDKLHLLYAVYGMAIMFYFMMAWLFISRRRSRVRKLLCVLMFLIGMTYVKDLFILDNPIGVDGVCSVYSPLVVSIDIVALPLFVLILIELCFPRFLTVFKSAAVVAPFALCVVLYQTTLSSRMYYVLLALSIVYSILAIILVFWRLPIYRRLIQEEYSTINKKHFYWTYCVLASFVLILLTWFIRIMTMNTYADIFYVFVSVFSFALVAKCLVQIEAIVMSLIKNGFEDDDEYYTYLKEKASQVFSPTLDVVNADDSVPVLDERNSEVADNADGANVGNDVEAESVDQTEGAAISTADRSVFEDIAKRMTKLFEEKRVYLDPELRLSALAYQLGTSRTYMSKFFNEYCGTTFYDYVNSYRLEHSKHLLTDTDYTYEIIASMSGFNSLSTFRRAFQQMCGCSPKQWRLRESSSSR